MKNRCKSLKKWPGPSPHPLFGNLYEFAFGPAEGQLTWALKLFEKYGPKFRFFLGPFRPVLIVADGKLLKFILSSPKFITKPKEYNMFCNWLGFGLFTSNGLAWKQNKRMVMPAFHDSVLQSYFKTFERVGDIFIRKLEPEVDKGGFDIMPRSSLLTLDIIYESALGESLNAQENFNMEYVECVDRVLDIKTNRLKSPLPYFLFPLTPNYWSEKKSIKISLLRRTMDGRSPTKDALRDEVESLIFAGSHTVALAVAYTIHCLAHNPEVQKKTVDEQEEIFGNIAKAEPTFDDMDKMEYLDMVIKESMRLYPPVPGILRDLSQGFEYEGNSYQGVTMIAAFIAAQRDPRNFPDPLKFNPDRFKDYDSKKSFVYLPFSAGPRRCMGRKFAMVELKSVLSKLVRNYEVVPATPPQPLSLLLEIVTKSKNGVHVAIKRRGAENNLSGMTRRKAD
ncbi:hypothetical protein JTB14_023782 [Gonioctena quinquepunctata]|nr:hypothetical protein JTB14_023782 [Gonioctena quinquepunctata]